MVEKEVEKAQAAAEALISAKEQEYAAMVAQVAAKEAALVVSTRHHNHYQDKQ